MSQKLSPKRQSEIARVRQQRKRGPKPVHLEPDKRYPQNRQAIWTAIRKLRRFTLDELERATKITLPTLRSYLQGLCKAGYLRREADSHNAPSTWTLSKDCGVTAPRVSRKGRPVTQGQGRAKVWQAMRILKEFSIEELRLATGNTCTYQTIKDYAMRLQRAGYLRATQPRASGRGGRYRLLPGMNPGPAAPMIQRRAKRVFDPNLERVVWPASEAGHE